MKRDSSKGKIYSTSDMRTHPWILTESNKSMAGNKKKTPQSENSMNIGLKGNLDKS